VSEIEFAARVVALLAAAVASYKGGFELLMHSRARLRDEYRFAKEFLSDMKAASTSLDPFLRDKGLQALAGTDRVSANEVEYLLKQPEPAMALKDYVFSRNILDHHATAGDVEISFKRSWRSARKRWLAKAAGLAIYVLLFMLAMSPLYLALWDKAAAGSMGRIFVTLPVFGAMAALVLVEAVRIARAERLVERQVPRRGFRLAA
jgi:hypothetical protein